MSGTGPTPAGQSSPDLGASSVPATPTPAPTGSPSITRPGPVEVDALLAAVRAEHSAVYGYGVVGGQARADRRPLVRDRLAWHAARRDELAAHLSAAGHKVPAGAAAYDLPFAVTSDASARQLAAHLESGVAAAWADLVAAAIGSGRLDAAHYLASCAETAWRWGSAPVAFPGLPERSTGA